VLGAEVRIDCAHRPAVRPLPGRGRRVLGAEVRIDCAHRPAVRPPSGQRRVPQEPPRVRRTARTSPASTALIPERAGGATMVPRQDTAGLSGIIAGIGLA
jgi:hypothetical protein